MLRRGTLLVVAVALGLVASACGRPEKVVITKYFEAVNQKDSQTLSSFATVDLNLSRVDDWKLVGVAEENDSPAPLPELLEQQKQAEAKVTATRRKIMDYNIQHTAQVDQVKELRRNNKPIPASLEAVGRIWEDFVKEDREVKRAVAEAKARVEAEKRIMTLSLGRVEDDMTGMMHTSALNLDLTISGQVKPYLMTLRQYKVQTAAGLKPMSRWIVVGLAPKQ